jgi:hypothetical protein
MMQDPIWSSTPTMTVGMTEARATLKSPVEKVPERLVINFVLQILWIYVIIKPVLTLCEV